MPDCWIDAGGGVWEGEEDLTELDVSALVVEEDVYVADDEVWGVGAAREGEADDLSGIVAQVEVPHADGLLEFARESVYAPTRHSYISESHNEPPNPLTLRNGPRRQEGRCVAETGGAAWWFSLPQRPRRRKLWCHCSCAGTARRAACARASLGGVGEHPRQRRTASTWQGFPWCTWQTAARQQRGGSANGIAEKHRRHEVPEAS